MCSNVARDSASEAERRRVRGAGRTYLTLPLHATDIANAFFNAN
jgi:hypothetical protein